MSEADNLLAEARSTNHGARALQLYNQITNLWVPQSPKTLVRRENVTVLKEGVTRSHTTS